MNLTTLIDTPRLYTALAEWGACLVYIFLLRRKMSGLKLSFFLGGSLIVFVAYHEFAGTLPIYFWIPCMIGAAFLMCALLHLLCDTAWLDAWFCCAKALVLAEFAASLHWQLYVWWALTYGKLSPAFAVVTMTVLYTGIYVGYYFLERGHFPTDERLQINGKELLSAVLIALGAFAISNISFVMPNTPFSSATSSILYVRTLVDFGGLVMLFSMQEKREELRMRSENQTMNILLQRQYDQYRLSIDNIELLRREFHDLKHYMIAIRSEQDPKKKEQYLSEMEEAIHTQEAFTNTGNSVLDVVLTTKSTYCMQKHITFTCMADGKLISFMHVKDICSIFGNALDNAIECVSQFDDPEKRLITLSMYQKNQLLMIQCENYTDTILHLKSDQLPSTTKQNAGYHGYGLKSIQHAAQKYGGSMTLHAKDHWFTLQVLIPLDI